MACLAHLTPSQKFIMPTSDQSPLILVDGSSYLFRAYHVPYLQALSTSDGQPTGAITGVLNMIKSLKKDYPNGNIVVIFGRMIYVRK